MRYIGGGPHDKAMTEIKIKQWIENYKVDGFGLMAVIFKETNQLIGFCGLMRQTVDGADYCYELNEALQDLNKIKLL